MRGDDETWKIFSKGPHLKGVQRQPSDEKDRVQEGALRHNGAQVIPGIPYVEAVDDVFKEFPFVLKVDHVGLGEDGAAARDTGRLSALQPQGDKVSKDGIERPMVRALLLLVHGCGQTLCLLIDEGSRA